MSAVLLLVAVVLWVTCRSLFGGSHVLGWVGLVGGVLFLIMHYPNKTKSGR